MGTRALYENILNLFKKILIECNGDFLYMKRVNIMLSLIGDQNVYFECSYTYLSS